MFTEDDFQAMAGTIAPRLLSINIPRKASILYKKVQEREVRGRNGQMVTVFTYVNTPVLGSRAQNGIGFLFDGPGASRPTITSIQDSQKNKGKDIGPAPTPPPSAYEADSVATKADKIEYTADRALVINDGKGKTPVEDVVSDPLEGIGEDVVAETPDFDVDITPQAVEVDPTIGENVAETEVNESAVSKLKQFLQDMKKVEKYDANKLGEFWDNEVNNEKAKQSTGYNTYLDMEKAYLEAKKQVPGFTEDLFIKQTRCKLG